MNVAALAIPLTGLFDLTNFGAAATAGGFRFVLNTSTNGEPLFMGEMTLLLIVFAHSSGFPLAHSASHQLGTIGFANIFAAHEDVEHSHITPVIVQVKLTAPQS